MPTPSWSQADNVSLSFAPWSVTAFSDVTAELVKHHLVATRAREVLPCVGTRPMHGYRWPRSSRMAEVCHTIYTSTMALSIKSDEADQLARQLAAETGETLTEAVVIALRERLDREHARHAASMRARLARLAADVAVLPVAESRAPEEIIGYDDAGLPR